MCSCTPCQDVEGKGLLNASHCLLPHPRQHWFKFMQTEQGSTTDRKPPGSRAGAGLHAAARSDGRSARGSVSRWGRESSLVAEVQRWQGTYPSTGRGRARLGSPDPQPNRSTPPGNGKGIKKERGRRRTGSQKIRPDSRAPGRSGVGRGQEEKADLRHEDTEMLFQKSVFSSIQRDRKWNGGCREPGGGGRVTQSFSWGK